MSGSPYFVLVQRFTLHWKCRSINIYIRLSALVVMYVYVALEGSDLAMTVGNDCTGGHTTQPA